eukprot:scaffold1518_cov331-Pavlova_lutheri.AAC.34
MARAPVLQPPADEARTLTRLECAAFARNAVRWERNAHAPGARASVVSSLTRVDVAPIAVEDTLAIQGFERDDGCASAGAEYGHPQREGRGMVTRRGQGR